MENWRFIKENNDYMVSDHGRIMSLKKPQKKILSSSLLHNGYEAIYIYQKGIHAARYVHRLVAETFIPNPKKLPQVNHLDGNTLNNHVSNLEWCDAYDNLMHAIRTGLRPVNVPRSIPCAVTDESGTILHPYPSMKSMVKEEKLNSAQYSWLQLKLTHPERVRLHTMRRWHLPYLPIPPDCTPVRHSVTRQYYRLLSAEEAAPVRNRTSPPPTSKAGTVPADSGRSVTTMSSASTEQSNPEETSPSTAHIAWGGTNGQSASAMSADWTRTVAPPIHAPTRNAPHSSDW